MHNAENGALAGRMSVGHLFMCVRRCPRRLRCGQCSESILDVIAAQQISLGACLQYVKFYYEFGHTQQVEWKVDVKGDTVKTLLISSDRHRNLLHLDEFSCAWSTPQWQADSADLNCLQGLKTLVLMQWSRSQHSRILNAVRISPTMWLFAPTS